MSDHLPVEIQQEILKRVPVKSLLRFRQVSKSWRLLISGPNFIASYRQQRRLLIRYRNYEDKYVSTADNEAFGQQQFSPFRPSFNEVNFLSVVLGSSDGLLCLYGFYKGSFNPNLIVQAAVIWNPSIRRSVVVLVPKLSRSPYGFVLGFGVSPVTRDPKIVKILYIFSWWDMGGTTRIPGQVEIFSLSSGSWRISQNNAHSPRKSIEFAWSQVALGQFIHWVACDRNADTLQSYNLIMAFDMVSEAFREINLPDSLANQSVLDLTVCKLGEYLTVIEGSSLFGKEFSSIWMMKEYGVPKSCSKIFTIEAPHVSIKTLGFRNDGDLIIEEKKKGATFGPGQLVVYDPHSGHVNRLGIYGRAGTFFVNSYKETLLLFDQPDGRIYHYVPFHVHEGGGR